MLGVQAQPSGASAEGLKAAGRRGLRGPQLRNNF